MLEVTLTNEEIEYAESIGRIRQREAELSGLPDCYGLRKEDGQVSHELGALGEFACCKAYDLSWPATVNTFRQPDFTANGFKVEVKTRSESWYDLLVRPDDHDDRLYMLVVRFGSSFVIYGGMFGRDAKQEKWTKNHGGRPTAYFVPKTAIIPARDLIEWLNPSGCNVSGRRPALDAGGRGFESLHPDQIMETVAQLRADRP
jgi:hypothetical protein